MKTLKTIGGFQLHALNTSSVTTFSKNTLSFLIFLLSIIGYTNQMNAQDINLEKLKEAVA